MSRYQKIGEAIDLLAGLVPNGAALACGDPALMLRTVVNDVYALRARVADLEEQVSSLEAKLDDRQEALADLADGVDNPFYDPEAIGCGLEDRGLTDRYEAAEYGWTCCQEAYRSWIEGLTAALVAEPMKEPAP